MTARKPMAALLLSFLMWGGGHLYVGRAMRFFVAVLIFISIWFILVVGGFLPTFIGYILGLLSTILFGLFYFIDPVILARKTPLPAQRWYMKRTIYVVYFFACISLNDMALAHIGPNTRADVLGFDFHHLATNAMAPTLLKGDYVLTDTRAYRQTGPVAGDVVQVRYADKDYIRRVLSVSGKSLRVSTDEFSGRSDTNEDLLINVEIPLSAVKGRLTYVVFSSDVKRIRSKITELDQSTLSAFSTTK
jgi:hypothetical protein